MNVTFRQLKVFEAVARHMGFTRAAEELHLSQPAVSMQVKQLEGNVGLPLFEQVGKKIFLTEAGREMHYYCRIIREQMEEAEDVFEQLKGGTHGRFKISVATTTNSFAIRMLADFAKTNVGANFSLDVANRQSLLSQLSNNECDLVLMGKPPEGLDLEAEPFMENPLVMIASPEHKLAGEKAIPLSAFESEVFVEREVGSGTRAAMQRFFERHGIEPNVGMEMTSNEAIKQAVEAGLGLAVVSVHTLELELEAKRLVTLDVEAFPIMRHWYLVYRKGKRLSPVAQAFREFVHERAAQIQGGYL